MKDSQHIAYMQAELKQAIVDTGMHENSADLRARRDVMEVLLVCSTSESSSRNCFLERIVSYLKTRNGIC